MTLVATEAMRARLARAMPVPPLGARAEAKTPRSRPPQVAENFLAPHGALPGHPAPGAQEKDPAARRAWRARKSDLYARLRRLSPSLFAGRPVPLMRGIREELIRRLSIDDEQDLVALRLILHQVVTRPAYQAALAVEGAMRCDLDGNSIEPISDLHRARAQDALEKLKRKARVAKQSGR
jgi:sRNA-binding protein